MTRFGWAIAALLLLAGIALALTVRVTGPGRAPAPAAATMAAPTSVAASPAPAGALVVPVRGVARGALADSWGDARGDGTRAHHGIDIMAPAGAPVLAAAPGRIEKLFASDLGGLTVYQRAADGGTVYYYAHLSAYAAGLAEGQVVRAGQAIGAVGSTGDADAAAPHLHFEVHRMAPGQGWSEGVEVDPYPLLTAAR